MNEAPTADGGPGFLAFLAFFLLALALWFLMRNMNARMRRMSYRQQAAHRGKDDPQAALGPGGAVGAHRPAAPGRAGDPQHRGAVRVTPVGPGDGAAVARPFNDEIGDERDSFWMIELHATR